MQQLIYLQSTFVQISVLLSKLAIKKMYYFNTREECMCVSILAIKKS